MPKVSVTLDFSTPQEAAAFLLSWQNGAGAPATGAGTASPPSTPTLTTIPPSSPPPPAMQMGNLPPPGYGGAATPPPPAASPPTAPSTVAAPPAPSAPPPAPPPAPAPSAAGGLQGEVLQAMQAWSKAGHKAAGIKRVLTKAGIASVSAQTPQQTLEWLKWAFSPLPDGSFLTPEYIESV